MRKATGRQKILYSSILLTILAFLNTPLLYWLTSDLRQYASSRSWIQTVHLLASLAAMPYQVLLLVGSLSGIILAERIDKAKLLKIMGIILLIPAGILIVLMGRLSILMIITVIPLGFYLYGAIENEKAYQQSQEDLLGDTM